METGIFEPIRIEDGDKYGVAVPVQGGSVMVIETFPSREQLETGYTDFYSMAKREGLTLPLPVEYVEKANKRGSRQCRIMRELIKK